MEVQVAAQVPGQDAIDNIEVKADLIEQRQEQSMQPVTQAALVDQVRAQLHQEYTITQLAKFYQEADNFVKVSLKAEEFVWIKMGSMAAYSGGGMLFERESLKEEGFLRAFKEHVTGESMQLVKAKCTKEYTDLFLSDKGNRIMTLHLQAGEAIVVADGTDVLAAEHTVSWSLTITSGVGGIFQGNMLNVKLSGPGVVSISCREGKPIMLPVKHGCTVHAGPRSVVMWSANLENPIIKANIGIKYLISSRFKSGEELQIKFNCTEAAVASGWILLSPKQS